MKKIKLRYVTERQYAKWKNKNCDKYVDCKGCPFCKIDCIFGNTCWANNKDMYSDKFLDQEIEIEKENEEEKIRLTDDEKVILKNLDKKYKYIVRNSNGEIRIFETKPVKLSFTWSNVNYMEYDYLVFPHLFKFVTWEDNEPTLIEDLLKGEE